MSDKDYLRYGDLVDELKDIMVGGDVATSMTALATMWVNIHINNVDKKEMVKISDKFYKTFVQKPLIDIQNGKVPAGMFKLDEGGE